MPNSPSWYQLVFMWLMQLATLIVPAVGVWLVLKLIRRFMGVKKTSGFLPKPAPRPSWVARATDALLLVTLAG